MTTVDLSGRGLGRLVPGSVGVAYGDRRPQWAWSRSASSELSGRGLWRASTSLGVVTSLICISRIPVFTLLLHKNLQNK